MRAASTEGERLLALIHAISAPHISNDEMFDALRTWGARRLLDAPDDPKALLFTMPTHVLHAVLRANKEGLING